MIGCNFFQPITMLSLMEWTTNYYDHQALQQTTPGMIGCKALQPINVQPPRDTPRFLRPITIGICCWKTF